MTPADFIAKWRASELKERSAAQEHFIDLCRLLDEPTPAEADPAGESYCFEAGARKDGGAAGWADVWKRGCFAWEYKSKGADFDDAFNQLRQYALALENPPLPIVSDMARFRIRTAWTNSVSETHEFALEDLARAPVRARLKWAMSDPERLRPGVTRHALTERAAASFAALARSLRARGHAPQAVAHFVNRLAFCMFAEDVGLLPDGMFARMLKQARKRPEEFAALAGDLFGAMATGGRVGFESVAWFNGGLFDDASALPLTADEIEVALRAAALDWSEIDPSILGTLFERGLDPDKRSQLGAHYTDRDKIAAIVEPTVVRPLLAEWETAKAAVAAALERASAAKSGAARARARGEAAGRNVGFHCLSGDVVDRPFVAPEFQRRGARIGPAGRRHGARAARFHAPRVPGQPDGAGVLRTPRPRRGRLRRQRRREGTGHDLPLAARRPLPTAGNPGPTGARACATSRSPVVASQFGIRRLPQGVPRYGASRLLGMRRCFHLRPNPPSP